MRRKVLHTYVGNRRLKTGIGASSRGTWRAAKRLVRRGTCVMTARTLDALSWVTRWIRDFYSASRNARMRISMEICHFSPARSVKWNLKLKYFWLLLFKIMEFTKKDIPIFPEVQKHKKLLISLWNLQIRSLYWRFYRILFRRISFFFIFAPFFLIGVFYQILRRLISFFICSFFFSRPFTLKTPLRALAALDNLNRLALSNDSRARRMSRSHFAYRARHGMRSHAWRSVISRDASLAEDLFARGGRCAARASGCRAEAERRACEANLSRGESTRCALHSRHRKSVWEVVQAFGRVRVSEIV